MSDKSHIAAPRAPKTQKETLVNLLTNVRFWGGISAIVALISLALPWWGITVVPLSSSWGLFFGPQSQPQPQVVVFFQDRLDQAFAMNYSIMTGLVVLTTISTIVGASLKRASLLGLSLVLSIITALFFLVDVNSALSSECLRTLVEGGSCISGFVGQGNSGSETILWGFQAGFYVFLASTGLLMGTLALARVRRG